MSSSPSMGPVGSDQKNPFQNNVRTENYSSGAEVFHTPSGKMIMFKKPKPKAETTQSSQQKGTIGRNYEVINHEEGVRTISYIPRTPDPITTGFSLGAFSRKVKNLFSSNKFVSDKIVVTTKFLLSSNENISVKGMLFDVVNGNDLKIHVPVGEDKRAGFLINVTKNGFATLVNGEPVKFKKNQLQEAINYLTIVALLNQKNMIDKAPTKNGTITFSFKGKDNTEHTMILNKTSISVKNTPHKKPLQALFYRKNSTAPNEIIDIGVALNNVVQDKDLQKENNLKDPFNQAIAPFL